VEVEVFEVVGSPTQGDALPAGHYWRAQDHQLFRGPFRTAKAAGADAEALAKRLLAVVLVGSED
jgi:hypothetical protein